MDVGSVSSLGTRARFRGDEGEKTWSTVEIGEDGEIGESWRGVDLICLDILIPLSVTGERLHTDGRGKVLTPWALTNPHLVFYSYAIPTCVVDFGAV